MDCYLDPIRQDYQVVQGRPVRDPLAGLANAVYLRLMTPLGSYWADPTLGSRLHELQRSKDLSRNQVLAKQYAEAALAPLLTDGRALAINVEVDSIKDPTGAGRLQLAIQVQAASGELATFVYPLAVI